MTYRGLMADICWELCETQLPESSASPRIEHRCLGTHPEGDDHYGDCSGPRTRSRRHLSIFRHITQLSNRCQIMTSPPSSLRVLPRRSRSRSPSLTPTIHPSQPLSTAQRPYPTAKLSKPTSLCRKPFSLPHRSIPSQAARPCKLRTSSSPAKHLHPYHSTPFNDPMGMRPSRHLSPPPVPPPTALDPSPMPQRPNIDPFSQASSRDINVPSGARAAPFVPLTKSRYTSPR